MQRSVSVSCLNVSVSSPPSWLFKFSWNPHTILIPSLFDAEVIQITVAVDNTLTTLCKTSVPLVLPDPVIPTLIR